jgi:hypothetical protein
MSVLFTKENKCENILMFYFTKYGAILIPGSGSEYRKRIRAQQLKLIGTGTCTVPKESGSATFVTRAVTLRFV